MLARFAGTEGAVGYQLGRAAETIGDLTKAGSAEHVEDDESLWARLSSARPRDGGSLVWRASVLPTGLGALLGRLGGGGDRALRWHAGAGDGRLRVFDEARRRDDSVVGLRAMREAARAAGGSLVVERAPEGLKRELGAWGLSDSSALLMKRLKEQLDPSDTFSPGLFG
jgi:glycolate oxidase FAD binding subunit